MAYSVTINQLAVGQGESCIIVIKNNDFIVRTVLIDGGKGPSYEASIKPIYERVAIQPDGVLFPLSRVITTHYDLDHLGGVCELVKCGTLIDERTVFIDRGLGIREDNAMSRDFTIYATSIQSYFLHHSIEKYFNADLHHFEEGLFERLFECIFRNVYKTPTSERDIAENFENLMLAIAGENQTLNDYIRTYEIEFEDVLNDPTSVYYWLFNSESMLNYKVIITDFFRSIESRWASFDPSKPDYWEHEELLGFGEQYAPTLNCIGMNIGSRDENDKGLGLVLNFNNFTFYTGGDLPSEIENENILSELVKYGPINVFKLGHHGSHKSTAYNFIYGLRPTVAIVSCGDSSQYQHPPINVLRRLFTADQYSPLQKVYLTEIVSKKDPVILEHDIFNNDDITSPDGPRTTDVIVLISESESREDRPIFSVTTEHTYTYFVGCNSAEYFDFPEEGLAFKGSGEKKKPRKAKPEKPKVIYRDDIESESDSDSSDGDDDSDDEWAA